MVSIYEVEPLILIPLLVLCFLAWVERRYLERKAKDQEFHKNMAIIRHGPSEELVDDDLGWRDGIDDERWWMENLRLREERRRLRDTDG